MQSVQFSNYLIVNSLIAQSNRQKSVITMEIQKGNPVKESAYYASPEDELLYTISSIEADTHIDNK